MLKRCEGSGGGGRIEMGSNEHNEGVFTSLQLTNLPSSLASSYTVMAGREYLTESPIHHQGTEREGPRE